MATKENKYISQLKDLGVWQDAFEPAVHSLAILEREEARARKEWKATAAEGSAPSVLDEHYAVICQLRREILTHREALGLTPKGLSRLRGKSTEPTETAVSALGKSFDKLWEAVSSYE